MNKQTFLFDTYAIIEIIKGNDDYARFINAEIIINDFILSELAYILIKLYGKKISDKYVDQYAKYSLRVSTEIIKEAMSFKHERIKQKLSMTDCIGYLQAKKLGIKFLTGDKEFEKINGVEFKK
ncbi:hypothetical protein COV11_01470 [Candidatus Woesearchaeota archaeon CG10_big_fil_rev_8_21_14_0_10_30_7]|nr:MAG: hypothetical protein COV11_01470 [Candidatus Woesearchaeota archaeon CG10_big_fil_rev_8_21_14_0_10_30_7]